ncbi:MAG: cytochrome c oxidase assembly protein [Siculibacillus sp.]
MTAPDAPSGSPRPRSGNGTVVMVCLAVTFGMLSAAFASVPLYRWFCATTGYGGTPMQATTGPQGAPGRVVEVGFDTNVFNGLPWGFESEVPAARVTTGEMVTVTFRIENLSDEETHGIATFNVSPPLAAAYFTKLTCFCFSEQVLKPREVIEAPVTFYVDQGIDRDKNVAGLAQLTLSYTFFATPKPASATPASTPSPTPVIRPSGPVRTADIATADDRHP